MQNTNSQLDEFNTAAKGGGTSEAVCISKQESRVRGGEGTCGQAGMMDGV